MKKEKGQDTVALNVIIVDKPSKPEDPLECKAVTPDSCTLTWNKPKDDGGSLTMLLRNVTPEQEDGNQSVNLSVELNMKSWAWMKVMSISISISRK